MSQVTFQGTMAGPGPSADPYKLGSRRNLSGDAGHGGHGGATGHGDGGPASPRVVVGYGFWIFLLSDIIMFSAFFAAFAVLERGTAGGPTGHELFDLKRVGLETACLLLSSFTCGLSNVASDARSTLWTEAALLLTGLLGLVFLLLELQEFYGMIQEGAGPQRSAFLSAFFALVGCHGLHVFCGLLWLGTMMAQVWVKGFRRQIVHRLLCFNLFWHALDIIWVALFTVVYLIGSGA
jgi:cytochrome o ubiquinol oxidase subunit III